MQIWPPTGREIAADLGYRRYTTKYLYKIKVNTQFGIYYLSKMLDQFDRDYGLAVRAYNCGPQYTSNVVAGIFRDYPQETREYARIILGDKDTEGYVRYYQKLGL